MNGPASLADLQSPCFRSWLDRMRRPWIPHRKFWEFAYIAQALAERGRLGPGRCGLGLAVGSEPLPALFASLGCQIVATDQPPTRAASGWAQLGMHATGPEKLNRDGICPDVAFARLVSFRFLDMNTLAADLEGFDFLWSSCAIEHLGSIERAIQHVRRAMRCLAPGGVAVHTTELNLTSDIRTIEERDTVILRERDLRRMAALLEEDGHRIGPLDFEPEPCRTDLPPYDRAVYEAWFNRLPCLRLRIGEFNATSFGFVVEKGQTPRAESILR